MWKNWKKWADRLLTLAFGVCVLVVVWLLLQITCVTSFRVPSHSMYPTLVPGDYILVNKWIMGARICKSVSPHDGEIRWDRIMKKIE